MGLPLGTELSVLTAANAWVKLAAVAFGATALTDDQVIPSDDDGPRPKVSYLTIAAGPEDDLAELSRFHDLDGVGDPQVTFKQSYQRIVELNGFGAEAGQWLSNARAGILRPDVIDALDGLTDSVQLITSGPVLRLPIERGTNLEPHYVLEVEARYTVVTGPISLQDANTIDFNTVFRQNDDDPTPLDVDFTVTI